MTTIRAKAGLIRTLVADDERAFADHLLRLDLQSRRDRFNGSVDDIFVRRYARETLRGEAVLIGCFQADRLVGVAEMHAEDTAHGRVADVAFSVEPTERRQGMGTTLFSTIVAEARGADVDRLKITCATSNVAMRALAKKFGARFEFDHGEAFGTIDLTHAESPPLAAEIIDDMVTLAGRVYRIATGHLPFWPKLPGNLDRRVGA